VGLSRSHHQELNRGRVSQKRLAQLRHEYARDSVALQQIDVYDGSSRYGAKFREYIDACKKGNEQQQASLEKWFKRNYPDI